MPLNVVIQLKIQLKRQAYTNKRAVIFLILLMKRTDSVEYREYHAAKVYDRLQFISENVVQNVPQKRNPRSEFLNKQELPKYSVVFLLVPSKKC